MWDGVTCHNLTNHVVEVDLSDNLLGGLISDSVCDLHYLQSLDLGRTGLKGTLPPCLGNLSHLQHLQLDSNDLSGKIPPTLGSLTNLIDLTLSNNQLSGSIPSSLGGLSSLQLFYVYDNQLCGSIPFSFGNLSSLTSFYVARNNLSGTIPLPFAKLSSLRLLYARRNAFNESISSSALPSSIEYLGLSLTHNEPISETFFSNFSHLNLLLLENCVLNISTSWIPSFQLSYLYLESCKMNGQFPLWISTQYSLEVLVLSGNNLVGEVPSWVWNTILYVSGVDFSNNQLEGNLFANASLWMGPSNISFLILNDNWLSGNIPPVLGTFSGLRALNLENNNFSGNIPPALASCSELQALNLRNNGLKGRIPRQFGKLSQLLSLELSYNKLEGTIPLSVTNCSNLQFLCVGRNSLEGRIPKSIRHLSALRVLVLSENHFGGGIPSEIGQLMQLQILDLSSNGFSGSIPHNISCLKEMANASQEGFVLSNCFISSLYLTPHVDGLYMTSKGVYLHYVYIYSTFRVINLSNNRLSGVVPSDLGNLKGLRQLNLSMNNFSGSIPDSLGEISLLESLDLSTNRFSGKIPQMLDSLNNLGVLNLSNNNLSGSIPQGSKLITFAEASYSGNPYLWECPLPKNCSWPQYASPPPTSKIVERRDIKIPWYGIALGLSYGAGFGGTVTMIAIFYQKYFEKVDMMLKLLFPWLNNWTV